MTDEKPNDYDTLAGFVEHFADGSINTEATLLMRDAVQAAMATQKKASVTLTIDLNPSGSRTVAVVPKLTSKIPQLPELGVFFVDGNGALHREDPYQLKMDLDEAPAVEATIVAPTETTAAVVEPPPEAAVHQMPPAPPILPPDDRDNPEGTPHA